MFTRWITDQTTEKNCKTNHIKVKKYKTDTINELTKSISKQIANVRNARIKGDSECSLCIKSFYLI